MDTINEAIGLLLEEMSTKSDPLAFLAPDNISHQATVDGNNEIGYVKARVTIHPLSLEAKEPRLRGKNYLVKTWKRYETGSILRMIRHVRLLKPKTACVSHY